MAADDATLPGTMSEVRTGLAGAQGDRDAMEDRCGVFFMPVGFSPVPCAMVYVADGHGGSRTADIIRGNLREIVQAYCKSFPPTDSEIEQVFSMLDDMACAHCADKCDGATLVIAFVTPADIAIAHCGDSKAFVVDMVKNDLLFCTSDHNAHDNTERNRVKEAGGFIFMDRLMGILSITRAIGDADFKRYGLICMPHITRITPSKKMRIVLASDGLWTGMEWSSFMHMFMKTCTELDEYAPQQVARVLVEESYQFDNVAVVVCDVAPSATQPADAGISSC